MSNSTRPNDYTDLSEAFRKAMRHMASSVCVISTRSPDGRRAAMTATSPTSLSLDPPAMLVCIHRHTAFSQSLGASQNFCINILGAHQIDIAKACGGGQVGDDKFKHGQWIESDNGLPILEDTLAVIGCRFEHATPYGTHDIIIGKVSDVRLSPDVQALIYADGHYQTLKAL